MIKYFCDVCRCGLNKDTLTSITIKSNMLTKTIHACPEHIMHAVQQTITTDKVSSMPTHKEMVQPNGKDGKHTLTNWDIARIIAGYEVHENYNTVSRITGFSTAAVGKYVKKYARTDLMKFVEDNKSYKVRGGTIDLKKLLNVFAAGLPVHDIAGEFALDDEDVVEIIVECTAATLEYKDVLYNKTEK